MQAVYRIENFIDAVQAADFEKVKFLLADDFMFSGPVPEPINGSAWLGMSESLKAAFPDLDYQFKTEGVDGDTVSLSAQLKGTHTGNFDLTAMGMSVIPPTNKSFAAAREHGKITAQGGKVWAVEPTEGAGLMAVLGQLGVKPPGM